MLFPHPLRLLALLPLLAAPVLSYDKTACNNSPSLCSAPYNSLLHLGAHNSAFVRTRENKYSTAGNQYFNVSTQLSGGIRLLQSQLHSDNGAVKLCHTSCQLFDAGLLRNWLKEIKVWLDANPSEVVTILLVNDDKISPNLLAAEYKAAGLDSMVMEPTDKTWQTKTLQEFIDSGKRVVSYLSTGADTNAVPWLMNEFDHIFETGFENTDAAAFSCVATRPGVVAGEDKLKEAVQTRMGLMNRFLYQEISKSLKIYVNNDTYAATVNGDKGVGNLKDGVETCFGQWGKRAGYVILDFVNEGNPAQVVDSFNNVTNPVNRQQFPKNPKDDDKERNQNYASGWDQVEKLAAMARNGTKITTGQWVFAAGDWKGVWDRL
ncbi:PLC-like phosphodiesterase [Pyronema domesticum]|uniref:Similar to PI-PLC X domain-containing protein At5g67130 acc. no. Q93XX5 n=1 Tax=Pyronema omphalodes (strain CBS 100304) TaxID=1076935 RepID=U4KX76_PYROM|nr:PLC-like phosphodiesterase [Pyronema domesticum]CCX06386.1 Similar to PI-PLC X domain-containing protein At5g67130; acc. no. Q93XX5 [Pyronema omphalodes CBS 100304]